MNKSQPNSSPPKAQEQLVKAKWWGIKIVASDKWMMDSANVGRLVHYPVQSIAKAHAKQLTTEGVPCEAQPFED